MTHGQAHKHVQAVLDSTHPSHFSCHHKSTRLFTRHWLPYRSPSCRRWFAPDLQPSSLSSQPPSGSSALHLGPPSHPLAQPSAWTTASPSLARSQGVCRQSGLAWTFQEQIWGLDPGSSSTQNSGSTFSLLPFPSLSVNSGLC